MEGLEVLVQRQDRLAASHHGGVTGEDSGGPLLTLRLHPDGGVGACVMGRGELVHEARVVCVQVCVWLGGGVVKGAYNGGCLPCLHGRSSPSDLLGYQNFHTTCGTLVGDFHGVAWIAGVGLLGQPSSETLKLVFHV